MKRSLLIMGIALLSGIFWGGSISVQAADLGLVQLLSKNLGVTQKQATGGAGSIFNVAKGNMSDVDFSRVAQAVPGIDKMIAASPKSTGAAGMLGAASSLLGGSASSVDKVAGLSDSFSQLGMKEGMVGAFMPIIMDYVKSKGGEPLMMLLQSALR